MKKLNKIQVCEKIETLGFSQVNAEELISLLIGNSEKARHLVNDYSLYTSEQHFLAALRKFKPTDFKYYGLTDLEAARIYAAIQLGAKISNAHSDAYRITSPADGANLLMEILKGETSEKFYVVLLSAKNTVIKIKSIAEGTLTSALVSIPKILREAILSHSCSLIISHNHPSGDPYPSVQDRELTKSLVEAAEIVGISVLDHIIIGENRFYSFKQHLDM